MRSLSSLPVPLLFAIYIQGALAQNQKCYGMNGVELDSSFAPCNRNATHSGCCATNRTSGSPDLCLSNGLCMATNDEYIGTIWQAGCTDPTRKDAACPKICPSTTTDGTPALAWNLQMCDYGSYCCREATDHSNCCTNPSIPRISTPSLATLQLPLPLLPSNNNSTNNSTSSPFPSPSPASPTEPTATPEPILSPPPTTTPTTPNTPLPALCAAEKRKTATMVGGAVGGITGAALLALVGLVLWMHGREKRQRVLKEHYEEQFRNSYKYLPGRGAVAREEDEEEDEEEGKGKVDRDDDDDDDDGVKGG